MPEVSVSRAIVLEQSPSGTLIGAGDRVENLHTKPLAIIEQLKSSWEKLPSSTPMQHYAWAHSCAAVLPCNELQVFTAGSASIRAVAAFTREPQSNTLLPLGNELCEPTEFAFADADAVRQLCESFLRSGNSMHIRDMYAESTTVQTLLQIARRRVVTHPFAGHPWLELDDSWLEPESHLNAGRRSDLRRARRHIAKLGPIRCDIISPTPAALPPLLREAFQVEAAGWKGVLGSALAVDPKIGAFYSQFAQEACTLGNLRIGILRIGDRAAAMQLGIERDGVFWLFKMGFDESFARYSPGSLLFVESVRKARERGCYRFELMGRTEAWNRIWSPRVHEAVTVNLCAASARGWVAGFAERTAGSVRTTVRNSLRDHSVARRVRRMLIPMVRFAARSYIAGPELKDALPIVRALARRGRGSTVGYWDDAGAAPAHVLDAYIQLARALRTEKVDSYISVKAPSLQFSQDAFLRLIDECEPSNTRLHFDSLWLDSADPTRSLIDSLLKRYKEISCTLPGRWTRSVDDAEWAIRHGIGVRVVKGQWSDPSAPLLDAHRGFLNVIERLAGRARSVSVATHCPKLAASALDILTKAGTPCELELLFGLPSSAVLKLAASINIKTRVYVPYGVGWLPYSLLQMRRNPRIVWWVLKDAIRNKSHRLL